MEQRIAPTVLMLAGGVLIWAAAFLAAYVFSAVACARGFADASLLGLPVVPVAVGIASIGALGGIATVAAIAHGSNAHAALRHVALVVCLLGAAGVLWNAVPALIVATRC